MNFQKLRMLKGNQTGIALMEMIIGVAITGFIGAGLVTTIFQALGVSDKNSDHMVTIIQLRNAAQWIGRDVQMAQNIDVNDDISTPEKEVLTISWVSWERKDASNNQYIDTDVVRYTHDGDVLTRELIINTEKYDSYGNLISATESQETSVIARYITAFSAMVEPVNKLDLTISALLDGTQKDYIYKITPRPNS